MKKMIKMISMMTAALLAAASFTACGTAPVHQVADENADGALTYISMRINPEIEVVANEDGEIVSVNAINEDGEVVLSEVDLVGQTVAEAGETFTEIATELGYLDADSEDATVYIDAEGENEELSEKLEKDISDRIHRYFDNNGIFGKVSPETLDQYAEKAAEWGLSAGQVKMVIRLLDLYPEMTEDEALALTPSARMAMLRDSGKKDEKISATLRDELNAEIETIREKYAATFALGEELKTLRRSLEDETLTAEERAAIEAQIAEKQAEYETQMKAYRDEVKVLKKDYRDKTEKVEKDVKRQAHEKREQNEKKIREHKKNFEADREETEKRIKEWRGQQEHVHGKDKEKQEKPVEDPVTGEDKDVPSQTKEPKEKEGKEKAPEGEKPAREGKESPAETTAAETTVSA